MGSGIDLAMQAGGPLPILIGTEAHDRLIAHLEEKQVLNTKSIGIRFTEMCVDLGLTQSPITYPKAKISYEDFTRKAEQAS